MREGGPQARLRVQQEVGRDDHPLAVREPREDLEGAADAHAELHLARLEAPLAAIDEHELAAPAVDHRALWDGQARSEVRAQVDVGEHVGLQLQAFVPELDPDLDGPGLLLDGRVDVRDCAAPLLSGQVGHAELALHPDPDEGQVGLVDVRQHPDVAQVGDVEERVGGGHPHAVEGQLLDHVAGDVGVQVEGAFDLSGLLECLDVLGAHIPQQQPLARRREQVERALGHRGDPALGHLLLCVVREQVLLLCRHEIGAVDGQQRLAPPYELPREVDVEVLHVAVVLRVDVVEPPLVHRDPPHGSDHPRQLVMVDLFAADAEDLSLLRREGEARPSRDRPAGCLSLVLVDRDEVHSHRVLGRLVGSHVRVHRGAVVGDPPLPGRLRGGLARHELHPADRAVSGLVGNVARMHRTVVEGRLSCLAHVALACAPRQAFITKLAPPATTSPSTNHSECRASSSHAPSGTHRSRPRTRSPRRQPRPRPSCAGRGHARGLLEARLLQAGAVRSWLARSARCVARSL